MYTPSPSPSKKRARAELERECDMSGDGSEDEGDDDIEIDYDGQAEGSEDTVMIITDPREAQALNYPNAELLAKRLIKPLKRQSFVVANAQPKADAPTSIPIDTGSSDGMDAGWFNQPF